MLLLNDFVGDLRVHKEARDLAEAGHDVRVVATRFHAGPPPSETRSGYEVIRIDFGAPWRRGLRSTLTQATESRRRSLVGRVVDRIRQHPVRSRWLRTRIDRRFGSEARRVLTAWRPDAIHAHDLETLHIAARIARELGVPFVYDSHELWRANNFLKKRAPGERRAWEDREARYITGAAAVITTTKSRAAKLREWYPTVDPVVVMNCQDGAPTPRTDTLRRHLGLGPEVTILLYQGLMHEDRGIFVALDALRSLPDDVVFVAIGPGAHVGRYTRRIAVAPFAGRAFYVPPVHHDELAAWTASADIGLSLIQNSSLSYYLSAPNKLFEFMRAGLPMVASDFPEVARLWALADLGERVDPADSAAVAAAVRTLLADGPRRARIANDARRLVETTYNWERQAAVLRDLYASLPRGGS